MNGIEPVGILLVEDDPGDQKLVKTSFMDQKIVNRLIAVESGEEALDFLYHRREWSNNNFRPDLILLDLNIPGIGGKEFLRRIKSDNGLKDIPVVILTTSDSDSDLLESYRLQAAGYVKKPVKMDEFRDVIRGIGEYWFVVCKLPPKEVDNV